MKLDNASLNLLHFAYVLAGCVTKLISVLNMSVGVPRGVDYRAIKTDLEALDGVKTAHSLNVWALTVGRLAVAVHLAVGKLSLTVAIHLAVGKLSLIVAVHQAVDKLSLSHYDFFSPKFISKINMHIAITVSISSLPIVKFFSYGSIMRS